MYIVFWTLLQKPLSKQKIQTKARITINDQKKDKKESIKECLTTLFLLYLNKLIKKLQGPVITPIEKVKRFVLPLLCKRN